MGRRSHTRVLNAWMNGLLVGEWRILRNNAMEFQYDQSWLDNRELRRPLSLSLPLPVENAPLRGPAVEYYFDNLLPDSDPIRRRLQSRFHTESQGAFDLLTAIGRDCVGALQLLPRDVVPTGITETHAQPLSDREIEQSLVNAVTPPRLGRRDDDDDDDFRISIAGAQEKTAFTLHEGRWCRPRGATPTTHIFKLPLGRVGARQADMRTSAENEWLCARLLEQFGVPVPRSEIKVFGNQKVLVVERFDRRHIAEQNYWVRLPQEDFCQALGKPSSAKYEKDHGPGILEIARVLRVSETPERDVALFLRAQILFWMLAATDGHAKNFSIYLHAGGSFKLTPVYDVLSAWPIVGTAANKLDYQKLRMAMAWHGDANRHYRLRDVQRRHLIETARRCGYGERIEIELQELVQQVPLAIAAARRQLPAGFPMDVFATISEGLQRIARKISDR